MTSNASTPHSCGSQKTRTTVLVGKPTHAFQSRICKFKRFLSDSESGMRAIIVDGARDGDMPSLHDSDGRGSMQSFDGPVSFTRLRMVSSVDPDGARDTAGGGGSNCELMDLGVRGPARDVEPLG